MSSKPDKEVFELKKRIANLEKANSFLMEENTRIDKERIEYLQNVAHQLVAPLNAMKWHIENLTAGRVSIDRGKKVLRSIYSQATLAVHLAKNFALMSNLEADLSLTALREPLEPVDLKRLLINLADDFQPLGWDKSIDIEVDDNSFAGVPDVLVIRQLISQVFSNIIDNAVKYSNKDSAISIKGSYSSGDDAVTITIANQGVPIDEGEIEELFARGYRSAEAKRKNPAGTGFGLYIAKKIVEIHEGSIKASSRAGRGANFEVTLFAHKLKGKAKQWGKKQSY